LGVATNQQKQCNTAKHDLREAQAENRLPQSHQPCGCQFETNNEQQQNDPDFGKFQNRFGIADQLQTLRPDENSRDQVTENSPDSETPKQ